MDDASPTLHMQSMQSISKKLLEVDQSLSQAQHEGVSFLCAALVPCGKLYDPSPDSRPSVSDCFSALNDHRDTQSIATSVLLYILRFVGCNRQLVTDLQQLIHGSQETVANARSTPIDETHHASLSDEASQKLRLRELLHDVHEDLPKTDQKALMHLSVCHLDPPRNVNYTTSLFVHFAHLIQQEVITPSNLQRLYHWLNVMGKQTTLRKIDNYCGTASIPVPKRTRIERYNVYGTSASATATMSASPSAPLSESVTRSSPSIQGNGYLDHVGNAEPLTVGSVDSAHFLHSVEATSRSPHVTTEGLVGAGSSSTTRTDLSKKHERGGLEWSIPHGPVARDKASPAPQGASGPDEHSPVNQKGEVTAIRFSDDAAYVRWSSGDSCGRFAVTIRDKHEEKSYDARSNQLVLTKLRPDTCYKVAVSGLSQDGVCVWRGTVPIPSNEKPNRMRITEKTSTSLTMEWNRINLLEVEGYRVQYIAGNDSRTQDVSGAGNHTVTLTDLEPDTEYTVQVAALYERDVAGPYSDSIITATLPPSAQGSSSPGESPTESLTSFPLIGDNPGYGTSGEPPRESTPPPTSQVHSKKPKKKHWICCCVSSTLSLPLVVGCAVFLLVYNLHTLRPVTVHREIRGNDTFALYTPRAFKYRQIEIDSQESLGLVEIYSQGGHCNEIPVSSKPYNFEWHESGSFMSTYDLTRGYFGHSSKLIFQANVTGQVDLSNCSAAVYLFDKAESFCKFLEYDTTENYVHRVCFNISNNGSGYNHPQSYFLRESDYLFLGLYLPPIGTADHADLAISGEQSYYNRSELTSRCNISLNSPTCSFSLSTKSIVLQTTPVCILSHWATTNTETRNVQLTLSTSLGQNLPSVIVFPFCVTLSIVVIIFFVFCLVLYFCRR